MISNLLFRLTGFLRSAFSSLSRRLSPNSSSNGGWIESPSGEPWTTPEASDGHPLDMGRAVRMKKAEEGFENEPYQDHLGYWTIGVGHLIDPARGGSLPKWAEAELTETGRLSDASVDRLLADDIAIHSDLLDRNIPWAVGLDPVRYGVLLDMTFQMGIGGVLGFENTLRYIRDGDYDQAARNMRQSLWYRQTPNRAKRRIEEMRTGEPYVY